MEKTYLLRLESNDLGQILDGLSVREESWQKTAEYFASGFNADGSFLIEECSGELEATQIAAHYHSIISKIRKQMEAQS